MDQPLSSDNERLAQALSRLSPEAREVAESPPPRDRQRVRALTLGRKWKDRWGLAIMFIAFGGIAVALFSKADGHYGCAAVPSALLLAVPVLYWFWVRNNRVHARRLVERGRLHVGKIVLARSYYIRASRVDRLEIIVDDGIGPPMIGVVNGTSLCDTLTQGDPVVLFLEPEATSLLAVAVPPSAIWIGKTKPASGDERAPDM